MIDLTNLAAGEGLTFNGISAGDALGAGITAGVPVVGDFNGDGVNDILLGAPGVTQNATDSSGAAYLLFGRTDGNINTDLANLTASDGIVFQGEAASYTGSVVARAGDVNGDGFDDFLIGAQGYNSFAGRAYLVLGNDDGGGTVDLTNPGSTIVTIDGAAGARVSSGFAAAGDLNGDGRDDFLVGALADTQGGANSGTVFALLGSETPGNIDTSALGANDGFALTGDDGLGRLGRHIAVGDFNSDGNPDIVGGDSGEPARVGVFLSSDPPTTADQALGVGGNPVIQFGNGGASRTPVAVGDFDGDGADDLLIGLPGLNGAAGGIYAAIDTDLLADTTLGGGRLLVQGVDAADEVGTTVSNVGDFNGDGIDDIGIGSSTRTGAILFGGPAVEGILRDGDPTLNLTSVTADNGLRFEAPLDASLYAIEAAGDVNGDGFGDVTVRSPDDDSETGFVAIVFGRLGGIASADADSLIGGSLAESVGGGAGGDTIFGNGGADTIDGGDGDDLIAGGDDNDSLAGGDGNDAGYGQAGDDTLAGDAGDDNLRGNLGNDSVTGGPGGDTLRGHVGDDSVSGGAGADLVFSGGGNDVILATDDDGADTLNGNSGSDSVEGGAGDDVIRGQAGIDTLLGGVGDDTLRGMQGNDVIFGGAGNDLLSGGPANDTMTGGADFDIFEFAQFQGSDTVNDFNPAEDMLSFVGFTFAGLDFANVNGDVRITIAEEGDSPTLAVILVDVDIADVNAGLFVGG
ncbi:MAG: hypothetical protein RIM84_09880 [Alphaproteobacteria bacterium]